MATHENLASLFTDIADAIRAKTEKTGAIVADNFPAEIAAIETVGDDEISITENGVHDVKKFATANVNVQSEPELLWTNASPTSQFKPQTISLDASDYSAYLVECRYSSSTSAGYDTTATSFIKFATYRQPVVAPKQTTYVAHDALACRTITSADQTGIVFGSCSNSAWTEGACNADNYWALGIPTRIWGVKFAIE